MIPCLILIQRRSSHAQRTSHPIRSLESKRMPGGRSAIPLNRENSLQAALGNNLRRIVLNVLFAMQRRHAVCEVFIRTRYGEDKAFQELSGTPRNLGPEGAVSSGVRTPPANGPEHCSRVVPLSARAPSTAKKAKAVLCTSKQLSSRYAAQRCSRGYRVQSLDDQNRRNCCQTARNPPDDFIRKIPDAIFAVDRKGKVIYLGTGP